MSTLAIIDAHFEKKQTLLTKQTDLGKFGSLSRLAKKQIYTEQCIWLQGQLLQSKKDHNFDSVGPGFGCFCQARFGSARILPNVLTCHQVSLSS